MKQPTIEIRKDLLLQDYIKEGIHLFIMIDLINRPDKENTEVRRLEYLWEEFEKTLPTKRYYTIKKKYKIFVEAVKKYYNTYQFFEIFEKSLLKNYYSLLLMYRREVTRAFDRVNTRNHRAFEFILESDIEEIKASKEFSKSEFIFRQKEIKIKKIRKKRTI